MSSAEQKGYVLNEVGLCLMAQGQLTEALPLLERSITVATAYNDWEAASKSRQNVAEIYIHLGRLQEASHAAEEAVSWIPESEFLYRKWRGLSYQAWSAHLQGELSHSDSLFRLAFEALSAYEPNTKYLYDLWGVWHAEHLRRTGRPEEAADRHSDRPSLVSPGRRRHDGSNRHRPTRPNRERKRQILLGSARLGRPARLSSRLGRPVTESQWSRRNDVSGPPSRSPGRCSSAG